MPPMKGKPRYALNFCLVPSEVHWKVVIEKFFFPTYGCQDFKDFSDISKRTSLSSQKHKEHIEIGLGHDIENFEHVGFLLGSIIKDITTAIFVSKSIQREDPNLVEYSSVFSLMKFAKNIILE
ncbi:MAG: hypothetical protein ACI936_001310 [Paraglaciecola sp.]|jgi:hypothetical protein